MVVSRTRAASTTVRTVDDRFEPRSGELLPWMIMVHLGMTGREGLEKYVEVVYSYVLDSLARCIVARLNTVFHHW